MNFLPIGSTASANVADVWLAQAINSYSMIIIIYYKALALVAGSGCWHHVMGNHVKQNHVKRGTAVMA